MKVEERLVNETQFTHRPVPYEHQGALEALVYNRHNCGVFQLPESGVVRVGRGPDNEIRIDDHSVSRNHLLLHIGSSIEVEDLGSANGTLLVRADGDAFDGPTRRSEAEASLHRGARRLLEPGDFVRAGAAMIVIQPRQPPHLPSAVSHHGPAILLDPEMQRAYEVALRAAQTGISVLITGETGAGKELFAEAIHQRSSRRGRPLLRLNCAALSASLLESELFGHERGAFTGANHAKAGLLESTNGGTVFLDEIGEMPLTFQAKLLRVLEERSVLRVGATRPTAIDVRFVWATNRDLRAEVSAGRFRSDLYYRIAGVEFAIPPLRERQVEIEPLARYFLQLFCERSALPVPEISPGALAALHRYSWPGNVRELKNVMERAPFACEAFVISEAQIPKDAAPPERALHAVHVARAVRAVQAMHGVDAIPADDGLFPAEELAVTRAFVPKAFSAIKDERERILAVLSQCAGNQTRAAKLLGVSRRTLINNLDRLNVPRPKKG